MFTPVLACTVPSDTKAIVIDGVPHDIRDNVIRGADQRLEPDTLLVRVREAEMVQLHALAITFSNTYDEQNKTLVVTFACPNVTPERIEGFAFEVLVPTRYGQIVNCR